MTTPPLKRSGIILYSDPNNIYTEQVAFALCEKAVPYELVMVHSAEAFESFAEVNPQQSFPTLADRELVLYKASIIAEYLDERFPHPSLFPVYPVAKARSRLMLYRIDQDWYSLYHEIKTTKNSEKKERMKQELKNSLDLLLPVFSESEYFLSDDFSLLDCVLGPLLWHLPEIGVELKTTKDFDAYKKRIFERESFLLMLDPEKRAANL